MGRGRGQRSPMPTMPWYREERIPDAGFPADDIIDSEYRINNPIWGGGDIPQPRQPIRGGPWMPPIMPSPPRGGKGGRRPPWSPPFRPPQRPQMPSFGWISPTGVTPEYRSWMPGMSFAAERSYRNPTRPFPIPEPIMPTPEPTPTPTPIMPPIWGPGYGPGGPGYGGPGYAQPYGGAVYGGPSGMGSSGGYNPFQGISLESIFNKGGKVGALAEGIATGMAVGGRTGYQGRGEIEGIDLPDNIEDYYGIGGGNLAIPPQPGMRSYGALPSPEGYRPGFDAEWNYFPYSNVPVSAYGHTGQNPYASNLTGGMGGIGGLAGQGWSGVPYSAYQSLFNLPEDFDPSSLTLPPQGDVASPPAQMPDLSNYLTEEDLSSFDFSNYFPDTGGIDLSQYVTQEDLQQGLGSFTPDLSGYLTEDQLGGFNPFSDIDLSQYLTQEDLTDFQQGLGSLYDQQGQFDPTTYDWSNIINEYGDQQEAFDPSSYDWSDIIEEYGIPFEAENLPYQTTAQLSEIANNAASGVSGYSPWESNLRMQNAGGGKQGLGFSRTPYQGLGEIATEEEVITAPPAQAEVIEETTEVTSEGDEELIQMAVLAIQGKHPSPDEVQKSFIERFGLDAWIAFRERILQEAAQNPEATTEGMIEGEGTGMSDEIPGVVAGQEKIAVSPGEFIVPADVVSGIGDGSSDSGSNRLYEMMDRVRQARTGTTEQPRPLNKGGILPA